MTKVRALVTGATGQDGQLLIPALVARDWHVDAVVRPGCAPANTSDSVAVHSLDLADPQAVKDLVVRMRPDYVFHLGAVSSVFESWNSPLAVMRVNGLSTVAILDGARELGEMDHRTHIVNASSAEIFAGAGVSPQTERTVIAPISPYGASKALGHTMSQIMRDTGVSVTNAILYSHESVHRPVRFVTRKISSTVAKIALGSNEPLVLGNLDARRDWGWAADYVKAMLVLADARANGDYVVATGEAHSVQDFVAAAFEVAGIDSWGRYLISDDSFLRPADGAELIGDSSRIRDEFGWMPTKRFLDVVAAMVLSDIEDCRQQG